MRENYTKEMSYAKRQLAVQQNIKRDKGGGGERERERERGGGGERMREREGGRQIAREGGRERERAREREGGRARERWGRAGVVLEKWECLNSERRRGKERDIKY